MEKGLEDVTWEQRLRIQVCSAWRKLRGHLFAAYNLLMRGREEGGASLLSHDRR